MSCPSQRETERQQRVASQMVSIHSMLRDEYRTKAITAEIILLIASVIFCATTFASDEVFIRLGLAAGGGRFALGIASVLAFAAALCMLVLDWRGWSARHSQSANHWSQLLPRYRETRMSDGQWPEEARRDLQKAYIEVGRYTIPGPDRRFVALKARHLRKTQMSQWKDKYPGCPRLVFWIYIRCRDLFRFIRRDKEKDS